MICLNDQTNDLWATSAPLPPPSTNTLFEYTQHRPHYYPPLPTHPIPADRAIYLNAISPPSPPTTMIPPIKFNPSSPNFTPTISFNATFKLQTLVSDKHQIIEIKTPNYRNQNTIIIPVENFEYLALALPRQTSAVNC